MASHARDVQMDDPAAVVADILASTRTKPGFNLSVSSFRTVYEGIQKRVPGTPVDIVLNGDWALAQFTRISNQRLRIVQDRGTSRLARFRGSNLLSEDDFEFALLHAEIHGVRRPLTFRAFVGEELSSHPILLLITLTISFLVCWIISTSGGAETLSKINELLITAATIYLSIFLLFTVSQNINTLSNLYLFEKGLTYRFLAIDRYIGILVLSVILICSTSVVLIALESGKNLVIFQYSFQPPDFSLVVAALTAIALTVLVDSFVALIQYYFTRVRYLMEQDLTGRLLDSMMEKRNNDQEQSGGVASIN